MLRLIMLTVAMLLFLPPVFINAADDRGGTRAEKNQAASGSERRLALVIGNAAYKEAPLKNPLNDADSMAAALQKVGFEVILKKNLNRKEMRGVIRDFGNKLAATGGMGLFYYAGHGMSIQGNNYLIPIGADIQKPTETEDEAISATSILKTMDDAKNGLNLLVLDACRNNPFASRFRNADKGLASMSPPTGVLVLYATSPGSVASDGEEKNGVFTKHFIDKMNLEGVDIRIMIGKVTEAVRKETANSQSPYMEGMITGEFGFRSAKVTDKPVADSKVGQTVDPRAVELQYWQSAEKSNTASAYRAYLKKYPNGDFADLAKESLQTLEGASERDNKTALAEKERLTREKSELEQKSRAADERARQAEEKTKKAEAAAREAEKRIKTAQVAESVTADPISAKVLAQGGGSGNLKESVTGMEFVKVPGGCFDMGNTFFWGDSYGDEKPVHEVCLSDFRIGRYEVTQGEWKKIMGSNPSSFSGCGDSCPVENVSWDDVQLFLQKLNDRTGQTSLKYRLPTEAEWEYAARSGGKKEKYSGGDSVDAVAWYSDNSGSATHPVGQKQPNGLGIYDMSGNVWEWVSDWYGAYPIGRQQNPQGAEKGSARVDRGGGWNGGARNVRAADRSGDSPDARNDGLGFRLVSPVQ